MAEWEALFPVPEPARRAGNSLATRDFVGAGIDAPFSIPERYLPDHSQLSARLMVIRFQPRRAFSPQ